MGFLKHAISFNPNFLQLWLLVGFVKVVRSGETLILVLVGLSFANVVLFAQHILIFSLVGFVLIHNRSKTSMF